MCLDVTSACSTSQVDVYLTFVFAFDLMAVCLTSQVDVHLTKFISDLKLRQADPLAPALTHTSSQDSVGLHSTALRLPLVFPERTQSGHDSNDAGSSLAQTDTEDSAASRGNWDFTFVLCLIVFDASAICNDEST